MLQKNNKIDALSSLDSRQGVICIDNLTKKYGAVVALDAVSLSIGFGEIVGILGPNGAGKTSLVSIIAALRKPTMGSVKVAGLDSVKEREKIRRLIGLVFQEPSLDKELTVRENLVLHGTLFGLKKNELDQAVALSLKECDLEKVVETLVKNLSGGLRQRVELAKCLLHNPAIYVLDEPTVGLDPEIRQGVWKLIRKLSSNKNKTFLITSHYLQEIEELCERVIILRNGRVVVDDSIDNLKKKNRSKTVLSFAENPSVLDLEKILGVVPIKKGSIFEFDTMSLPLPVELVKKLEQNHLNVKTIETKESSLEELYLKIIGESE